MNTPQLTKEELLEAYKATQRRIQHTSMNAQDLYAMIRLDMELEARGYEPVVTYGLEKVASHP